MKQPATVLYDNARIITRTECVEGSLLVEQGNIVALGETAHHADSVIDCEGDLLIPGLVELHTDNLEMNIQPRPGVIWPSITAAACAHDAQIAAAGITTVFDAIALGDVRGDGLRSHIVSESIRAISTIKKSGLFKADHYLHLRCEICCETMEAILLQHGVNEHVRLLSIMDHTPGQRQWSNLDDWRRFHREKKWTDEEVRAILDNLLTRQQRYAGPHRALAVDFARKHKIVLASHDDTTKEDCHQAAEEGVRIAEFPTTQAAARTAGELSMAVIMGAPNAVRGESHSGNIGTLELARQGLLVGISSDYVPVSLLQAAFVIHNRLSIPLPETIAMVSANTAELVGLEDRGEIAVGKRADLVRVTRCDAEPVIRQVWRQGVRIA
jgi:alpha-D-ribose 1-methylphosphonate 5-triphosphate diphosphatase